MTRNWTKVGAEFDRATVERVIQQLEWKQLPLETGMMQGLGIKGAIKELRIPKVTHVADTNQLAPYGFYGIRAHYTNGDADIYIVDRGSDLVPVCSDFYAKEGEDYEQQC